MTETEKRGVDWSRTFIDMDPVHAATDAEIQRLAERRWRDGGEMHTVLARLRDEMRRADAAEAKVSCLRRSWGIESRRAESAEEERDVARIALDNTILDRNKAEKERDELRERLAAATAKRPFDWWSKTYDHFREMRDGRDALRAEVERLTNAVNHGPGSAQAEWKVVGHTETGEAFPISVDVAKSLRCTYPSRHYIREDKVGEQLTKLRDTMAQDAADLQAEVERLRSERGAEEPELKPCPFCGSTEDVYASEVESVIVARDDDWACFCGNCKSYGPTLEKREDAIASWNRRAGDES